MSHDITLTVDYHDNNCVIRRLDLATGEEQLFTRVPTDRQSLKAIVTQAVRDTKGRGRVIWIQESTTGWARVQRLVRPYCQFVLANVLQMPLPPKARRRKTDKVDTARMQREYLAGNLPEAHQPPPKWRQIRRLVARREDLVRRQTAVKNWINRYLAHETWEDRASLWTPKGQQRLRALLPKLPALDAAIVEGRLQELDNLTLQLNQVLSLFEEVYKKSRDAQRLEVIRGISIVSAVSIVARIGPIQRFRNAEQLIAFAGLVPGVQQSDETRRHGRIGGGGTDKQLRHYLIEASMWARDLPRYRKTYQRVAKRRGVKVGRLVVCRMMLRSIYKMLRDGVGFEPEAVTKSSAPRS